MEYQPKCQRILSLRHLPTILFKRLLKNSLHLSFYISRKFQNLFTTGDHSGAKKDKTMACLGSSLTSFGHISGHKYAKWWPKYDKFSPRRNTCWWVAYHSSLGKSLSRPSIFIVVAVA